MQIIEETYLLFRSGQRRRLSSWNSPSVLYSTMLGSKCAGSYLLLHWREFHLALAMKSDVVQSGVVALSGAPQGIVFHEVQTPSDLEYLVIMRQKY